MRIPTPAEFEAQLQQLGFMDGRRESIPAKIQMLSHYAFPWTAEQCEAGHYAGLRQARVAHLDPLDRQGEYNIARLTAMVQALDKNEELHLDIQGLKDTSARIELSQKQRDWYGMSVGGSVLQRYTLIDMLKAIQDQVMDMYCFGRRLEKTRMDQMTRHEFLRVRLQQVRESLEATIEIAGDDSDF